MLTKGRLGASFVAHDADWQFPAITEQHAFRQAKLVLPPARDFVYLAFPWATLIDLIVHKQDSSDLRTALKKIAHEARGFDRVVTTCQHIFLGDFADLFHDSGVTDIFWSHARNDGSPDDFSQITIAPFPLYPVNPPVAPASGPSRRFLMSFVGARPNDLYLDNARQLIFDELSGVPEAYIRERDDWHFFRAVYGQQIYRNAQSIEDPLENPEAVEYRTTMAESLFTLCPSGTGPNSIRLWEAIEGGSLPVVLSPHYQPPGDGRLWSDAMLTLDTDRESIRQLPRQLTRIARDESRISAMRSATAILRARYGRDFFVYDIERLFRKHVLQPGRSPSAALESLRQIA